MDADLQYLIHFFSDQEHLFKTINMAGTDQINAISDQIASKKGWYWIRYSQSDREDYLKRRAFVERELYEGYVRQYGVLKEKIPTYFYIYPGITIQEVIERGQQRTKYDEMEPKILMIRIRDIDDLTNMTFTLNDSFTAYWERAIESGIKCREEGNHKIVLEDHNKVFPFSMLEKVHRKYRAQGISYEVQIWDHELLGRTRYTILGEK